MHIQRRAPISGAMPCNVVTLGDEEFPTAEEVFAWARGQSGVVDNNDKLWIQSGDNGIAFHLEEYELEFDFLSKRKRLKAVRR